MSSRKARPVRPPKQRSRRRRTTNDPPQLHPFRPGENMTSALALAESQLLAPAGMGLGEMDRAFARLMGPGVDFGDLYFQHSRRESWTVEDGIVKDGAH